MRDAHLMGASELCASAAPLWGIIYRPKRVFSRAYNHMGTCLIASGERPRAQRASGAGAAAKRVTDTV